MDLLQLRFADDCLSLDEYERRVAAAYQARTLNELDALVTDLDRSTSLSATPEYARIVTVLSNNERNGAMPVPHRLDIVCMLGNVELDISGATFAPGLTEIDISATLGNVELTVPLGVRVESSGNAFLGNFDCKVPNIIGYAGETERVIRITGRAVLSSVEIRAAPSMVAQLPSQYTDAPRRLS